MSLETNEFHDITRSRIPPDKVDSSELEDVEFDLSVEYEIERIMYGIAIVLGFIASVHTIRKFRRNCKKNLDVAARLLPYKVSLSVADALILFVYAPTQLAWITTYWWYGGEILCRVYKFIATFAFYLTGNMQVLIAFDRLITISHIAEVHTKGTVDYNSRLLLSIAWILAVASSLPQLFIFKIVYHNGVNPQCSSIWNEFTSLYEQYQERSGKFNYESTEMMILSSDSPMKEEWILMQQWEKIYNIVHVSMMIIIPYLLELILYALILSLLSEAQKGEFTGFRRYIHNRIVRFFHIKKIKALKAQLHSLPLISEDAHSDTPIRAKKPLTRRASKSAGSSPTHGPRIDALLLAYHERFQSLNIEKRRMTIAVDSQGASALHDNSRNNNLRVSRIQSRRATVPSDVSDLSVIRNCIPWMHTVVVVRRRTRKKAFIMLSLNLILWLPYFIHAVLSSFVVLDHHQFQFACALVVFNAITNILL